MSFHAPVSLDEALSALDASEAACLAGGQSLVATMNLGLASPERLVSLRQVAELRGIVALADGGLRIGAMTTHAELAALSAQAPGPALIATTARQVAYPAVRNRGTIGGSVALADPAADYPVALAAAGAVIELVGPSGRREVAARDFFLGLFETARAQDEIVVAVRIPGGDPAGGAAYEKLSLVVGDFAIVSVAAIGRTTVDLAIGGLGPVPLVATGIGADAGALRAAGEALAARGTPASDHRGSAQYRRRVAPELAVRAGLAAVAAAR